MEMSAVDSVRASVDESGVAPRTPVQVKIAERPAWGANGLWAVLVVVITTMTTVAGFGLAAQADEAGANPAAFVGLAVISLLVLCLAVTAIRVVSPGETVVLRLFGRYVGTVRETGLRATLPLVLPKRVSVRVRNFETNELKVNDADGNPVNIAAIIVWQVTDTAKASFAVENYDGFVQVQAESALRHVASAHPYDNAATGEETLRGSTDAVAAELAAEVGARIAIAGLEVIEARIASLAYAPEIAHAMLQRQQAAAVIAAREKIVEGAVSMVRSALQQLEDEHVVDMDEERKAAMVSNLLVVLCGSAQVAPVVNTGSLYT